MNIWLDFSSGQTVPEIDKILAHKIIFLSFYAYLYTFVLERPKPTNKIVKQSRNK